MTDDNKERVLVTMKETQRADLGERIDALRIELAQLERQAHEATLGDDLPETDASRRQRLTGEGPIDLTTGGGLRMHGVGMIFGGGDE